MATTIADIRGATTTKELEAIVSGYLIELGEFDTARKECESWGETAARLGGDSILGAAEAWYEHLQQHCYRDGQTQRLRDDSGKPQSLGKEL